MTTTNEPPDLGLSDAYAVQTPEDNRTLYRAWADSYEADFVKARGYVYHQAVADIYAQHQTEPGPILDVGCGTGVAGSELSGLGFPIIDGIDLSPEMMASARTKGVYRELTEVDVTQRLPIDDQTYDGVVSVGVFTHGHLGPDPLIELVRITRPSAVFAIGINAEHFVSLSFDRFLDGMAAAGHITKPRFERVRIYSAAEDEHSGDHALVALFRKV